MQEITTLEQLHRAIKESERTSGDVKYLEARFIGLNIPAKFQKWPDVSGSIFEKCLFEANCFHNADLPEVEFEECDFSAGALRNAKVSKEIFQQYITSPDILDGCIYDDLLVRNEKITIDFSGRVYRSIKFNRLESTDFGDSRFFGCIFDNCNFEESKFTNCVFETDQHNVNCQFNGCEIRKCNFSGSSITKTHFNQNAKSAANSDFRDCGIIRSCVFDNNFEGAKFNNSKLVDCAFSRTSLIESEFIRSEIKRGSFRDCDLFQIKLANARLQGVKMESSLRLHASQLKGLDLLGTTLPDTIKFADFLQVYSDSCKSARSLFITLIILCFYCWNVAFMHADKITYKLPFIEAIGVTKDHFLLSACVAIIAVFLYFHVYLQKIWDQISYLPARFPDGAPVTERVFPWIFSVFAWDIFELLKDEERPRNSNFQKFLCLGFGWFVPVATIWFLSCKSLGGYMQSNIYWFIPIFSIQVVIGYQGYEFYRNIKDTLSMRTADKL